jgi:glycosyltransferase involved in cell wall biosynthesis
VVMESWLCGTPVIVSAGCEVTAGHVARCDGGYAVVASSDFATALDRLSNAEVGAFPGQAGREHVLENFSWDAVTDRFVRAVSAR